MKTITIGILSILINVSLYAQNNIASILSDIETNNTTLEALRELTEAQKLENKTGIFLSNPEIGFNYLWGNPEEIGKRKDFSITQDFDIPTLSGTRSKFANTQNKLLEWQYKADRMNILLEAKQYCIDLIYYNALKKELEMRLNHAKTIVAAYKKRMEKGDANILEYNKARLNLSDVEGEISKLEIERKTLAEQLKRLNGGKAVSLEDDRFSKPSFPVSFDDWYVQAEAKNPLLGYVKQEVELSQKQISLNKMSGLPTFSAGYMSENAAGEGYKGVSLGMSIPLWANKNKLKQAKTAARAAKLKETDSKQQFYGQLQALYHRTLGLKSTAEAFRKSLKVANNSQLLKKALDAGEISLLDYILEIGLYYDTVNKALEAERDYQKAHAELSAVEL